MTLGYFHHIRSPLATQAADDAGVFSFARAVRKDWLVIHEMNGGSKCWCQECASARRKGGALWKPSGSVRLVM